MHYLGCDILNGDAHRCHIHRICDMDTNGVNAWLTDRSIVTIDYQMVEESIADNMYERSERDSLLFSDPAVYTDLVLNEGPGKIPESSHNV